MKLKRLLFPVLLLILASLACSLMNQDGGESGGGIATPESGPGAGATPEAGASPTSQPVSPLVGPGDSLDLDNPQLYIRPEVYNTYRTSMVYDFTAEGPVTGTLQMDTATQNEPFATTMLFKSSGNSVAADLGDYTFTQIVDTQYIVMAGIGCQSGATGLQGDSFDSMLETGGMLTGTAAFAGEENVNGIGTYVYTITMENIDPSDPAGIGVRTITDGRLNVAQDGGFIVRLILVGRGVNPLLTGDSSLEGDIDYELSFHDFGQPLTIGIPPECTAAGGDFEVPLPEDAADFSSFGDVLSFKTGLSLEEAADFYEDSMPAFGCSEPSVIGDGSSMVTMSFEGCEFGSAQVILTLDGESTAATIFITR